MSRWDEEKKLVADAIAGFPAEFGLKAWPGDLFAISRSKSYVNGVGEIMLVTMVRRVDEGRTEWRDFAKATPGELRAQMKALR